MSKPRTISLPIRILLKPIPKKIKRRIICEYINFKYRNYTTNQLKDLYQVDYHDVYKATKEEIKIKLLQAKAVQKIFLKKVLVAGCSSGLLVKILRNNGVDAYGFDICSDLKKIVLQGIKPYIFEGDIMSFPFRGFDTLIAIDVFEHIPMGQINKMIVGFKEFEYVISSINYSDWEYSEHITLKSLSWWEKKFKKYFEIDNNINSLKGKDGSIDRLIFWKNIRYKKNYLKDNFLNFSHI